MAHNIFATPVVFRDAFDGCITPIKHYCKISADPCSSDRGKWLFSDTVETTRRVYAGIETVRRIIFETMRLTERSVDIPLLCVLERIYPDPGWDTPSIDQIVVFIFQKESELFQFTHLDSVRAYSTKREYSLDEFQRITLPALEILLK